MSDRHRQYLAALGIPLWLSRRVLPGAALPAVEAACAVTAELATAGQGEEPAVPPPAVTALPESVDTTVAASPPAPALPDAAAEIAPPPASVPAETVASRVAAPAATAPIAPVAQPYERPAAPPARTASTTAPRTPARRAAPPPVPADIDDWLPPEADEPAAVRPRAGVTPLRTAPQPAPLPQPPVAGTGDDWGDYAQWAELAATGSDDEAPGAGEPSAVDERRTRIARMDWPELAASVAGCTACALCRTRTKTVFGTGDRRARLLFVGEAPGRDEDLRGEPFVGEAGRLLDAMLATIGLTRESVYIANVVKCRPPQNRDPLPAEAIACRPHLDRQIELIRPALIVALGRIAAHELLAVQTPVGRLRGRWYRFGAAAIPLLVTWHPAYLLRSPAEKAGSLDDLERLLDVLEGKAAVPD